MNGLHITEIHITPYVTSRLLAFVTITLNDAFVIRNIKIIRGKERLFVAMPAREVGARGYQDIVHPVSREGRSWLEGSILDAYLENRADPDEAHDGAEDDSASRARGRPDAPPASDGTERPSPPV